VAARVDPICEEPTAVVVVVVVVVVDFRKSGTFF
jgi:hypothetical protein